MKRDRKDKALEKAIKKPALERGGDFSGISNSHPEIDTIMSSAIALHDATGVELEDDLFGSSVDLSTDWMLTTDLSFDLEDAGYGHPGSYWIE